MSSFQGGGSRNNNNNYHNNNNNNRGGGGNYRGGRNNHHNNSRGGGRGGRGGRGRDSNGGGGGRGGGGGGNHGAMTMCREFTSTGNCKHGTGCRYTHAVQLHATVDAANNTGGNNNQNNNNHFNNNFNNNKNNNANAQPVSAVAIWEQPSGAPFKIFTGSHDGFWRLWDTTGGQFKKEFENNMNGKVACLTVQTNFLFCGFEAVCRIVPNIPVGMAHAWNLASPHTPPLELQVAPNTLPYAANMAVSCQHVASDQIVTGSRDGSIRVWKLNAGTFALGHTMIGHARQVTGLVRLGETLWSSGMDHCIRIWNGTTGECQHVISQETNGHSSAVTALLSFEMAGVNGAAPTTFILSASLDATVKVWNATTGDCVATETHNEGIVCMTIALDMKNNQVLLLGMESGNICCRNLQQTTKFAALTLLFTLSKHFTNVGHDGAVHCLTAGPAATFYSGGADGKMMVMSFAGDLGLN